MTKPVSELVKFLSKDSTATRVNPSLGEVLLPKDKVWMRNSLQGGYKYGEDGLIHFGDRKQATDISEHRTLNAEINRH